MHLPGNQNNLRGQTLIGVIISLAIFSILASAVFTLISTSYQTVNFNRARITGKQLAQEKIEFVRNLPYDDVGTIGGIPNGTVIPQTETLNLNGLPYTIKTSIVYVDDPFASYRL